MGLVAAGTGYQIVQNQANAVTREQVDKLIERDKSRVEPWQIDLINNQLTEIQKQQKHISQFIEQRESDVTVFTLKKKKK